jgi:hypothetical protein
MVGTDERSFGSLQRQSNLDRLLSQHFVNDLFIDAVTSAVRKIAFLVFLIIPVDRLIVCRGPSDLLHCHTFCRPECITKQREAEMAESGGGSQRAPSGKKRTSETISDIKALAFFAADYASTESGKLYVNGGFFNILRYPTYPAVVPTLGIAASLFVPWHSYQTDHHFTVTLEDEDRKELPLRAEGSFRIGADLILRHGDPSVFNIAGIVTNIVFERPGTYHLVLTVDNKELAQWELQARQLPAGLPTAAAPGG